MVSRQVQLKNRISTALTFNKNEKLISFINALQLVVIINRNETVLLSLTEYSNIDNFEWNSANALIPVDNAMDVTVSNI